MKIWLTNYSFVDIFELDDSEENSRPESIEANNGSDKQPPPSSSPTVIQIPDSEPQPTSQSPYGGQFGGMSASDMLIAASNSLQQQQQQEQMKSLQLQQKLQIEQQIQYQRDQYKLQQEQQRLQQQRLQQKQAKRKKRKNQKNYGGYCVLFLGWQAINMILKEVMGNQIFHSLSSSNCATFDTLIITKLAGL